MSTFLLIFGLCLSLFSPIISHLYFVHKNKSESDQKIITFLSILPGCALMFLGAWLQPSVELKATQACGVVNQYRTYSSRHHQSFERLAIVMDDSGYIRYFLFDENLPRIPAKQHICFDLYDRFKNKNLSESKITHLYIQ